MLPQERPEGTDHHLYDDAADGTADWRKDAYWATEGGGRLNALVGLTDENSRIHQKKPSMGFQHPSENNCTFQRDSANTIGRRRSATSIIADHKRKNVLRTILHEDHLGEHYSPSSGLVLEKDVAHGGYGCSAIPYGATKVNRINGSFDKIISIINYMPISPTI